jgi:Uma2 family endonuclease
MTAISIEKRKFTYEDYLKTPDDRRYELIEGELIMTPSPVPYHQWISKNIEYELERFVRERNLGKVFYAPCDVYFDDENLVQPDILFISKERLHIIGEKNIQGAPDLVIEILSETTAYKDLVNPAPRGYTRGIGVFPLGFSCTIHPRLYSRGFLWCGVKKKRLYAKFGVKEYWIVDPEEKTVEIYSLKDNQFTLIKSITEKNSLESPLLSGLMINLKKVFES